MKKTSARKSVERGPVRAKASAKLDDVLQRLMEMPPTPLSEFKPPAVRKRRKKKKGAA